MRNNDGAMQMPDMVTANFQACDDFSVEVRMYSGEYVQIYITDNNGYGMFLRMDSVPDFMKLLRALNKISPEIGALAKYGYANMCKPLCESR